MGQHHHMNHAVAALRLRGEYPFAGLELLWASCRSILERLGEG